MSFLGSGALRVGDDVFVGSGCHVDSIGSCGCGCGFRVISWDECDTLSKKIGFVFGKVINCMSSLVGKTYSLISKTISVLCIDKLFDFFSRIISGFFDKLYDIATWIFENCIRPIFVNEITQKIGEIITAVFNGINDYLMIPVGILIKKILSEPSKSCVEKTSVEKEDFKVVVIFKKFLHLIKTGLMTICDWTIVPVFNWTVVPLFQVIGDVFVGIVSGCSQIRHPSPEEAADL